MLKNYLTTSIALCCLATASFAAAPDPDAVLASGKFDEGIAALQEHLKQQPKGDNARFGLGAIQFVQSVRNLGEKLAVYGPRANGNPELERIFGHPQAPAELLTYPKLRQFTQEWLDDLQQVEKTLAAIESNDVKLPLHVNRISLTMARSGAQALTLAPILQMVPVSQSARGVEGDLVIAFDRADVEWLRGYCHLLSALGEIGLAYDGQELFDTFAHRVFAHAKTPHPFLLEEARPRARGSWFAYEEIADLIAAIHVLRLPVVEPKRMRVALTHLEQTLSFSRNMWKHILAETDNDREWIPNPNQQTAFNLRLNRDMVNHWMLALDEMESILQGRKLLPFWRGKATRGVNLRRVFLEPRALDLVLWVQGTAATPYLEEGELTRPDTWENINNVFQGQFLAFGVWFN